MRAEIVPFVVDLNTDSEGLDSIQGSRLMVIPGNEEVGVAVQGQPGYVYMPPELHPQIDEESVILLAGNIQITWTVKEWIALVPRIDELIQEGIRERVAAFGEKAQTSL